MPIRLEQPLALLLLLAAVPLVVLGWRALRHMDPFRRSVALILRTVLLGMLAFVLAAPQAVQEHDHLTVIGLLDVSGSVRRFAHVPPLGDRDGASTIELLRRWFRAAAHVREPDDRFGLVVFDGEAVVIAAPTRGTYADAPLDIRRREGTNIAEAIELGLALFPPDTARRLVLVSDGNETLGSAMDAVQRAIAVKPEARARAVTDSGVGTEAIPIDVLPLGYHVGGDVQVVRIEAPPSAQPHQTVALRIVLEATAPSAGRLSLRHEGRVVDLNGSSPGTSRAITILAGQSVHRAEVRLGESPVNRFLATFEPDDPQADALAENNRAEAFTATPGRGAVLVLDPALDRRPSALAQVLAAADIPVRAALPVEAPQDVLSLQAFDLVILDNVGAYELSTAQHELLARYVNDLGGGLIMVGGENSFGAGGWAGTALAPVLPVDLNPPRELRLPTAALVLVLDKSGSMNQPVAGARASQQQVANEGAALAIESLRDDSLVGVVTFDMFAHVEVPLQRNDNPRAVSQTVRGITAEGGTNLRPALERAWSMLREAPVERKRIVCLTDGRSHDTNLEGLARDMAADGIRITTIAVGDDADHDLLAKLAVIAGGEFYPVRNPRLLPRVLVDSVQVINKPLIREEAFQPVVRMTGLALAAGMESAPPLEGLVITAPRREAGVSIDLVHPKGEPLLAHWQAGLGRVAAFTSDAGFERWSRHWRGWPTAESFWTQLARTIARPPVDPQADLVASITGDRLSIALDMRSPESGPMDYLQVDGTVYRPDGIAEPVRLRQIGPSRYEADLVANQSGNYIVALSPRQGARRLAPVIGGATRSGNPEYRRAQSNLALLQEVQQASGGRVLEVEHPQAANLFDRRGMPRSISMLPAWRWLLWAALALLLLDVACRRVAWSGAMLRAWAARAIARMAPAQVRGRQVQATLASLRSVSEGVDRRIAADAAGIEKPRPRSELVTPADRAEALAARAAASRPDAVQVAAAIDELLGRAPRPDTSIETPEPGEPVETPTPPADETTEKLRAAKRRASQQFRGGA